MLKTKVVDSSGMCHKVTILGYHIESTEVLCHGKVLKRHCYKCSLSEETMETEKNSVLSNCPQSHLSTHVQ